MKKICFPHIVVIILVCLLLPACADEEEVDISRVEINTEIKRFDSAFFQTPAAQLTNKLPLLKQQYPAMFTNGAPEDFWVEQRNEHLQKELAASVEKVNGQLNITALKDALKRCKYYQLEPIPRNIYFYISRLDFDFPVLLADSLLFIATDLYLGADKKYYQQMPLYMAFERAPEFLLRDALEPIVKRNMLPPGQDPGLLDDMISQGKIIYALSKLLPQEETSTLLKYTPKELAFCKSNERSIWAYFIENNMLFDTSQDVKRRFMLPAPFSKFRTKLDIESPGQIGIWVGYQIVQAYAENTDIALKDLLREADTRKILKLSKYKP